MPCQIAMRCNIECRLRNIKLPGDGCIPHKNGLTGGNVARRAASRLWHVDCSCVSSEMKVAIPVFGNRVSPRLDCARQILILEVNGQEIISRQEVDRQSWLSYSDPGRMKALGVDVVICGGVRHWDCLGFLGQGIRVIPHVFGEVEEVVKLFLAGELKAQDSVMERKRRCVKHQRRAGRSGDNNGRS